MADSPLGAPRGFVLDGTPIRRVSIHCWMDGPKHPDGGGTTCMLAFDHKSPHRWWKDKDVAKEFPDMHKR